jgi:hypothetical protein
MTQKTIDRMAMGSLLFVSLALAGCGGVEQFPMAKTTGRVLCEGKPVAKAIVYFEPKRTGDSGLTGQQGFGLTDDDGKFTISTYGTNDGAVIGKHMVRVGKSENSGACTCALNAMTVLMEVEVAKNSTNEFEVVLRKKSGNNKDEGPKED